VVAIAFAIEQVTSRITKKIDTRKFLQNLLGPVRTLRFRNNKGKMWQVSVSESSGGRKLEARLFEYSTHLDSSHRVVHIGMIHEVENQILVYLQIRAVDGNLAVRISERIMSALSESQNLSITKTRTLHLVQFRIDIKHNYFQFQQVMAILDEYERDFITVKEKVRDFLDINIEKVRQTIKMNEREFILKFERNAENVMSPTLFSTAKFSEKKLRNGTRQLTESKTSKLTLMLIHELKQLKEIMIEEGFLVDDFFLETNISLSDYSLNLLRETHDNYVEVERAKFAFNVTVAVRAIFYGVYSMEIHKELNALLAFLYNRCLQAKRKPSLLNKHVNYNDAICALVRGISDGARRKNRDLDGIDFDNLKEEDHPACMDGLYVSLFDALNGVFPEIHLIYDWLDLFLKYLKTCIIETMINSPSVDSLPKAMLYLNMWLGKTPIPDVTNTEHAFHKICSTIKANFPIMIDGFISQYFDSDDVALVQQVRAEINNKIKELKECAYAEEYIETVSPDIELLVELWEDMRAETTSAEIHPVLRKRARDGEK
jgi:hypothetical protein